MLSPLQDRVASIIGSLEEAQDFALAGGAALIVRGVVNRGTRDLDFFGLSTAAVDRLVPAAEAALREAGLQVERVQSTPGFTRLVVADDGERTEVDLASDARLFPAEQGPSFLLLSSEELAVDKVLAVFGRAEARDFVDLMAIEGQFSLDHLFELAVDKDRGFTPQLFAEMAGRFGRLRREEFPIDDSTYGLLEVAVRSWHARALEYERSINHHRDRDTGLGL